MIISCPKQTMTSAAQRRKFEVIMPPDELNLLKDDHYNRIIPVNIAWIIQEAGILVFGDRIHESERRRVYLASDPDSQGPQPADRRGAARNAVQALHDAWLHPRPPRHHPAGDRERALHGREQRGPDPERARGRPALGPAPRPERPPAPHRRDHRGREARPGARGQGAGKSGGRGAEGPLGGRAEDAARPARAGPRRPLQRSSGLAHAAFQAVARRLAAARRRLVKYDRGGAASRPLGACRGMWLGRLDRELRTESYGCTDPQ